MREYGQHLIKTIILLLLRCQFLREKCGKNEYFRLFKFYIHIKNDQASELFLLYVLKIWKIEPCYTIFFTKKGCQKHVTANQCIYTEIFWN